MCSFGLNCIKKSYMRRILGVVMSSSQFFTTRLNTMFVAFISIVMPWAVCVVCVPCSPCASVEIAVSSSMFRRDISTMLAISVGCSVYRIPRTAWNWARRSPSSSTAFSVSASSPHRPALLNPRQPLSVVQTTGRRCPSSPATLRITQTGCRA